MNQSDLFIAVPLNGVTLLCHVYYSTFFDSWKYRIKAYSLPGGDVPLSAGRLFPTRRESLKDAISTMRNLIAFRGAPRKRSNPVWGDKVRLSRMATDPS